MKWKANKRQKVKSFQGGKFIFLMMKKVTDDGVFAI